MTCRIRTGDWKDKTMNLEGKRVLVVGSGKSGVAAAELLRKKGITFVLFDGNKDLDVTALIEKNPVFAGAEILLGELAPEDMARIDLVVLSPGVPTDLPMVNELRNRQIPIWGEIELAYHFAKGRIIAITGTNGKTTTTSLVGEIMANYFDDVKVVGNIGIPYTSVAADTTEDTVTVAEISSFQLETTHEFAPEVTAILNITPDHLNRHHTMECYIETKESITKNQTAGDTCVLNYEDEVLRRFGETLQTKVVFFSSKRKLEKGLRTDDSQRVEHAALGLIDGLHENFRKRAVQADLLKQLIAASPYPTLVCGDFNSLPSSYVYHTVKGDKLQDGFQTSGHGYMYTFKYFKHLLRIDYILHSPELNSTDYFSPDLNYSDHNPVVMRVKL